MIVGLEKLVNKFLFNLRFSKVSFLSTEISTTIYFQNQKRKTFNCLQVSHFPFSVINMLLVIDNYDSFTYNLVQYLGELGAQMEVRRNDKVSIEEIENDLKPERILISPGPGTPDDAGVSLDVLKRFGEEIPILGVCLGHQAIGQIFGGKVVRAPAPVHGKPVEICHDGRTIFAGIEENFQAARYHSLIVERESLPDCLEISAASPDGLIMGLRHKTHKIEGVQFHPESILTSQGKKILQNFLDI
jgi:anthranilate synthase/aminodeoxychorismate synthase-like glutamine amidotransferase